MKALWKLYRAMEEMRKINPMLSAHTVNIFVMVAIQPGVTMKELGIRLGVSQAAMSRNVAQMGDAYADSKGIKHQGYGLLKAVEDPEERRRKIVHLTPLGQRVRDSLVHILEEA